MSLMIYLDRVDRLFSFSVDTEARRENQFKRNGASLQPCSRCAENVGKS